MKLQVINLAEKEVKLRYSSCQKEWEYVLKASEVLAFECSLLNFHLQSNIELEADRIKGKFWN